jgi:hypothetical protein
MQKMLTGLVLVLTVLVGALGVAVLNLSDQVSTASRRGTVVARKGAEEPALNRDEIEKLLRQIDKLSRDLQTVRGEQRKTAAALARRLARGDGDSIGTGNGGGRIDNDPDSPGSPAPGLPRGEVSEEDEAWYTAVKESVDRKRRINGQLTNTMRRIERLAASGAINVLPEDQKADIEKIVLNYVTSADDLLTRYVRKPSEALKALPGEQRREAMKKDRDDIVKEAELALAPLLGDADTETVVERTLRSRRSWRGGDRGRRGDR